MNFTKTCWLVFFALLTQFGATAQGIQKLKIKLDGVETKAKVRRDLAIYPRNDAGFSALKADAESATRPFAVTITSGYRQDEILPAVVQPAPVVSWITAARYSFNAANRLDVELAGEGVELKFERSDGAPFSGSNPDLIALQSGTFYSPGPLENQGGFTQQWAFGRSSAGTGGIPSGVALKLTVKRTSTGATVVYPLTPSVGAVRLSLTGATSTTTSQPVAAGCDPSISRIAYNWDGGNNSVAIFTLATGGAQLQVKLTGPTTVDWTDQYGISDADANGYFGKTGVITGGYVVSTRVKNSGSAGCSYAFNVPSASQTLYVKGQTTPPGSVTTTPPGNTTTLVTGLPSITRGFVMGNSFTSHQAETVDLGWPNNNGMAASSYATSHTGRIETAYKAVNPAFQLISSGIGSGFETNYFTNDADRYLNILNNIKSDVEGKWGVGAKVKFFMFSIGENCAEENWNESKFYQGLDYLLSGIPVESGATVLFRNGVWLGQASANLALASYINRPSTQTIATARGLSLKFASMDDIRETIVNGNRTSPYYSPFDNPGVHRHYGDGGHQEIATRSLAQLGTTTTTPPITPPAGGYNYPIIAAGTIGGWNTYDSGTIKGNRERGQTYTIGEVARLESSTVRIDLRKIFAGSVQVWDKRTGRALINFGDWGRQAELCLYSGPQDYAAVRGAQGTWASIGWNPIFPGNYQDVPSKIMASGWVTGNDNVLRFYIKIQAINWPSGAAGTSYGPDFTECYIEKWTGLIGNEVDVKTRTTFFRTDKTFYGPRGQEYPNMMVNGNQTNTKYYTGPNPYTNDNGQYLKSTNTLEAAGQSFTDDNYFVSEPWTAVEYDQAGHYIFLNTERMGSSTGNVTDLYEHGTGENDLQMTLTRGSAILTIDPNGVWYHDYGFYVTDNFQQGRAWANTRPRLHGNVPNWKFDQAHGRNDWGVHKGYDQTEPFSTDNWKPVMVPSADGGPATARRSSLESPHVIHLAGQISTIYVRMKYSGAASNLKIVFLKNGQRDRGLDSDKPGMMQARYPNGAANTETQSLTIPLQNDGQMHTYAIATNGSSAWNGVIQQYKIVYPDGPAIGQNETIELNYFGVNNPGN